LHTRFLCIVCATCEEIEEVFFNVIDEITVHKVTVRSSFETELQEGDPELLEEIKKSFSSCKSREEIFENAKSFLQILNPETKESFILRRLLAFKGTKFEEDAVKSVFSVLGIEKKEEQKTEEQEVVKDESTVKNILEQQLKVLELAEDDSVVERTKKLVENVLEEEAPADKEKLKEFIKSKLEKKETKKKEEKQVQQPKVEHHKVIPRQIKIDQSQVDALMDLVGELLVLKNALPYIAERLSPETILHSRREILTKYEEISRVVERLQEKIMDMRLIPLSVMFNRWPKLVRELSKQLGKRVRFVQEGGETRLDKTVIDKLADPLVHVIRNAIDHGIESPEERIEKGKPEEGLLKVSAYSIGDKVYLTIEDDGKGIDVEKVVKKAIDKGIITPEQAEKLSYEEKLNLIFVPGLSTKDKVTELSGRGVGMDAVKTAVEELGGVVSIESQKDRGTTITLEIPISVALTEVFHVKMNEVNYAIQMDYIAETLKVRKENIKTASHKPYIILRGEIVPLVLERTLLSRDDFNSVENVVVIEARGKKYGFVVDNFIGQLDIVAKPLPGVLKNHPLINGVSLLGNGEIIFMLDVSKITV